MLKLTKKKKTKWTARNIQLTSMAGLSVVFLAVFAYLPMMGIILAFKDGNKSLNILQATIYSPWTLENFTDLIKDPMFWDVVKNTVGLNLLTLLFTFPAPIIFALILNEIRNKYFKKRVQTVVSLPHFLSWIVFGGIILALTDMTTGVINPLFEFLGLSSADNPVDLNLAQYFWPKMIIVAVLKSVGWGSIIYSAAIAGINQELYEAADIDGANRFHKALHITLPMIAPTITVFLLLSVSRLLGNSFEQFYIFQTTANISRSEVLTTFIYKTSFTYRNYSTGAMIGLFNSFVSVLLLLTANFLSKRTTGRGLF
jgi:putative aldouronate transport system permease protein